MDIQKWARSVGGANPYLSLWARTGRTRGEVDAAMADLDLYELPAARTTPRPSTAPPWALARETHLRLAWDQLTARGLVRPASKARTTGPRTRPSTRRKGPARRTSRATETPSVGRGELGHLVPSLPVEFAAASLWGAAASLLVEERHIGLLGGIG